MESKDLAELLQKQQFAIAKGFQEILAAKTKAWVADDDIPF